MVSWIKLTKDQIAYADALAVKRHHAAIENKRPAMNGAPTDYENALRLDKEGCRAELAGKLYLDPVVWHEFANKVNGLPDLDDFIDVKGNPKGYYDLIVQKDKPLQWAYLLVRGHNDPEFEITAWAWGHEVKQQQNWKALQRGRPAFVMAPTKPPSELYDELRRRQRAREVAA